MNSVLIPKPHFLPSVWNLKRRLPSALKVFSLPGSICQTDQRDRPVVGTFNFCPRFVLIPTHFKSISCDLK